MQAGAPGGGGLQRPDGQAPASWPAGGPLLPPAPGLSGGAWKIHPLSPHYRCGGLTPPEWAWGQMTASARHPLPFRCPTTPAGGREGHRMAPPKREPCAASHEIGGGGVGGTWHLMKQLPAHAPCLLWRHPRKVGLGALLPALPAELPRPGGLPSLPALASHLSIRFWFSYLCYWAILSMWNKPQKGDCGHKMANHPSHPSSHENKTVLNVFLCFCFYF